MSLYNLGNGISLNSPLKLTPGYQDMQILAMPEFTYLHTHIILFHVVVYIANKTFWDVLF